MSRKWIAEALTALAGVLFYGSAVACSPVPHELNPTKAATPFRYDFVAAVVDEEVADDPRNSGKTMVAALRLRVIRSKGVRPVAGSIVAMGYQYTGEISSTCARITRNLTLRDWRAGTRVRIQSNDLYAAESIFAVD